MGPWSLPRCAGDRQTDSQGHCTILHRPAPRLTVLMAPHPHCLPGPEFGSGRPHGCKTPARRGLGLHLPDH